MAWAPGLVRFAARYTHNVDDAEDAYQRAMEIALTRAPVVDADGFMRWFHTVLRREAMLVSQRRVAEVPIAADEIDDAVARTSGFGPDPQALVEWRERYRAVQDGMHGLTDAQRVCLMVRSAGASYADIAALTGYSNRTVHRAIAEGRARLRAFEVRMATGEECRRIAPMIDDVADDEGTRSDRRAVSRHVRHCATCRSLLRTRREQTQLLGSLVPGVLLGSDLIAAAPPDPGFAASWWERVSSGATVRSGQAMQLMLDVPALASTKAGAGALAAAAAGAIGTPVVVDAIGPADRPPARTAAITLPTEGVTVPAPTVTPAPLRPRSTPPSSPTVRLRTRATATTRPGTGGTTATTRRAQAPSRASASSASPALEFGP